MLARGFGRSFARAHRLDRFRRNRRLRLCAAVLGNRFAGEHDGRVAGGQRNLGATRFARSTVAVAEVAAASTVVTITSAASASSSVIAIASTATTVTVVATLFTRGFIRGLAAGRRSAFTVF